MTIAGAYLTPEGVVLGGDSTTTQKVQRQDGSEDVVQLMNHAQKVFEISAPGDASLGISTWGAAAVGDKSHRTILAHLSDQLYQLGQVSDVDDAIQPLKNIVENELKSSNFNDSFGYFLGGVGQNREPKCYEIIFANQALANLAPLRLGEAAFQGDHRFFSRLFHGADPSFLKCLKERIAERVGENLGEETEQVIDESFQDTIDILAAQGTKNLPMREAIDYIYSYLFITIKAHKFSFGPPLCGGPIELGFITTDREFRWVSHKNFDTALLEHLNL